MDLISIQDVIIRQIGIEITKEDRISLVKMYATYLTGIINIVNRATPYNIQTK